MQKEDAEEAREIRNCSQEGTRTVVFVEATEPQQADPCRCSRIGTEGFTKYAQQDYTVFHFKSADGPVDEALSSIVSFVGIDVSV